jgi:PAS domain-containing protein
MLHAADGRMTGMFGIAHDVTQRKAAEARLAQLNATLEQQVQQRTAELQLVSAREHAIITSAGSAIDLSGIITPFNPAAEAKFCNTATQAEGRSMLSLYDPDEFDARGHEPAAQVFGHDQSRLQSLPGMGVGGGVNPLLSGGEGALFGDEL